MKFNSSLKFNAVSEWWDEYIAYDTLKKYIYQLEKHPSSAQPVPYRDLESAEHEHASLLGRTATPSDAVFVPLLDAELKKITLFYEAQEKEQFEDLEELEELIKQQEEQGLYGGDYYMDDVDEDGEDEEDADEDESVSAVRNGAGGSVPPPPTGRPPARQRRKRAVSLTVPALSTSAARRTSVSSSEGGYADMELSTSTLPGYIHGGARQAHPTKSRSPFIPFAGLANKLSLSRERYGGEDETIWTARTNYAYDTRLLFKRRITTLYISFSNLKSYVEVNAVGFRKVLKKYDKVTYSELKDRYLHDVVEQALPFTQATKDKLNGALNRLLDLYAKCVSYGDPKAAKAQLKLHQRENIAWERDTVWRQMIGRERRGEGGVTETGGGVLVKEDDDSDVVAVGTPVGRLKVTKKKISALVALIVFLVLLNVQTVKGAEANRCFAILVFCTIMWATEAIPLFVTSLLVPLLLVCFRVIRDGDTQEQLSTPNATKYIFSIMFSPTIMLLIGGFTISSALSKTNIDRLLITRVLSFAGTKPSTVLLAFMGVSCFASMWISNVAAPTLCFTLIKPILRTLPPKSAFAPCLILAIALAANIGGQSSPISSPQNLIALQAMDPSVDWAQWFAVALPVSAISIVLIWLLLLVSYRPAQSPDGEGEIEIKTIRPTKEPFTIKQYWVSFVCVLTIVLWCMEHEIEEVVGDMGVIAILPVVLFFGTGVLKKDDFEQFAWTIVFLAMGGIALGKGVVSSGLLEVMDVFIRDLVDGLALYTVVLVLSPVVLVISTFISHTIASVLLVPIAKEVGSNLPGNHANLLIFITALICSAGMGMPVSGFPNQTAATQEDDLGELYLSNVDFLKNGVPASILATLVVSTVGFLLMRAVGL